MTTTTEEQPKPKRRVKKLMLTGGLLVCSLAIACAAIDGIQNAIYGVQEGWLAGAIAIAAAAGLVLFSHAHEGEKDRVNTLMIWVCAAVTLFCGVQQHRANQRNHALHEQAITEAYNKGRDKVASAKAVHDGYRAKAGSITEVMGSKELASLVESKQSTIEGECAVRGPKCRKAEEVLEEYQRRKGEAKAKEEYNLKADKAWDEMKAAEAVAPKQAKADLSSPEAEWVKSILYLLFTIGGATRLPWGWARVQTAWNTFEEPAKARKPVLTSKKPEQPVSKPQDAMQEFLDLWTEPAGESDRPMPSSTFYKQLEGHWASAHRGKKVPTKTALGIAMGKRYKKGKVDGNWAYQARLKKPELKEVKAA